MLLKLKQAFHVELIHGGFCSFGPQDSCGTWLLETLGISECELHRNACECYKWAFWRLSENGDNPRYFSVLLLLLLQMPLNF